MLNYILVYCITKLNINTQYYPDLFRKVSSNELHYPGKGDFIVNGKWTFEIAGRSKTKSQIRNVDNAFLVKDDLEYPVSGSLPLWLFGFIY